MSFIIAASDSYENLCVAADTKGTSKLGLIKYQDIHKIIPISDVTSIAISGDYVIALKIVSLFQANYNSKLDMGALIDHLKSSIIKGTSDHKKEYGLTSNCVFILAHHNKGISNISLLTLSENKVQVFQEPLQSGKYRFLFANPADLSFDGCLRLCRTILQSNPNKSLDALLCDIVCEISLKSFFVNDKVDFWIAHQLNP